MPLVVRAGVPQVLLQFPFECFNGPVFLFFFFSFLWGHKKGSGACPNSLLKGTSRVPQHMCWLGFFLPLLQIIVLHSYL